MTSSHYIIGYLESTPDPGFFPGSAPIQCGISETLRGLQGPSVTLNKQVRFCAGEVKRKGEKAPNSSNRTVTHNLRPKAAPAPSHKSCEIVEMPLQRPGGKVELQ